MKKTSLNIMKKVKVGKTSQKEVYKRMPALITVTINPHQTDSLAKNIAEYFNGCLNKCDPKAKLPKGDKYWLELPPVGNELL